MTAHYSMLIEWSEADQAFLVTLPEWSDRVYMPCAHGITYEDAARAGQEALEELLDYARQGHINRPDPHVFLQAS